MRTFFFFLLILSAGCRHTDPDLENALRQAGENRSQLEQVLDHYRNDSLKYKAACFLIANMPGHYSYGGEVLDAYYFSVDSLFRSSLRTDEPANRRISPEPTNQPLRQNHRRCQNHHSRIPDRQYRPGFRRLAKQRNQRACRFRTFL